MAKKVEKREFTTTGGERVEISETASDLIGKYETDISSWIKYDAGIEGIVDMVVKPDNKKIKAGEKYNSEKLADILKNEAKKLAGKHFLNSEDSDWQPDREQIESAIRRYEKAISKAGEDEEEKKVAFTSLENELKTVYSGTANQNVMTRHIGRLGKEKAADIGDVVRYSAFRTGYHEHLPHIDGHVKLDKKQELIRLAQTHHERYHGSYAGTTTQTGKELKYKSPDSKE